MTPETQPCGNCQDAIDLDRSALVRLDDAEVLVLACPEHLRRVALAIESLHALERSIEDQVPPLVSVAFADRVPVPPEHRP